MGSPWRQWAARRSRSRGRERVRDRLQPVASVLRHHEGVAVMRERKDVHGEAVTPRRRWARRHPWVTGAGLLVLLLVLCAGVPLALAAPSLLSARDAAQRGEAALTDGDVDGARAAFADAETDFRTARRLLRNPIATVGGVVPWLGHNARAAGALSHAGELTAQGAAGVADAVAALPGGTDALSSEGGALPVAAVRELAEPLATAADRLEEALQVAQAAPDLLLASPVADAREQLLSQLAAAAPTASTAAALADALPAFLGADGPRTYFFGASTPGELRGSGGLIGAHALLTIDDGRLAFSDFDATTDLPTVESVDAPHADYARYDRYQRDNRWLSMNLTPDFPTVGTLIERLYAIAPGQELDGVIVADPYALAALLRVAGPTDVPGFGTVDADSVVEFVTVDAYSEFTDSRERKEVLGAVAAAALQGFLERGGDPLASLSALAEATAGGHLTLHAVDPAVQSALHTAGVTGALPTGGDAVIVAANSGTNAKVDAFLEADLSYDVTLGPDGAASGLVRLELNNAAPREGVDQYVIGPNRPDLEAGDNRFFLQVFGAPGGAVTGFARDGERAAARIESELGLPALVTDVELPHGTAADLEVSTTSPDAWTGDADRLAYHLDLRVPPLLAGVDATISVGVPEGMELIDSPADASVEDGVVIVERTIRGEEKLSLTFARPAEDRLRAEIRGFFTRPVVRIEF